jgi:hypothetical protein
LCDSGVMLEKDRSLTVKWKLLSRSKCSEKVRMVEPPEMCLLSEESSSKSPKTEEDSGLFRVLTKGAVVVRHVTKDSEAGRYWVIATKSTKEENSIYHLLLACYCF